MSVYQIGTAHWTLDEIPGILNASLELSEEAKENIQRCRDYLDRKMQEKDNTYYGINTGFGALCNVKISESDIEQLQENLVLSHACGLGEEVPLEIVKIMLLLKIKNFVYGHSGVSRELTERLLEFHNKQIIPVVYEQGSLGASGDLAPLAHLSLPLLNRGEVWIDGVRRHGSELSYSPLRLRSKEGLALLNGTQFMSSYAVWCLLKIKKLLRWADLIAAMSFEGFDATPEPFTSGIHAIRKQEGQMETAANMRKILEGSELARSPKSQVQDPYSFRCIPQVHGASRDAIAYASQVVEREINAVTDNPLVFPEEDQILSGGNFHGQPLAITLDLLGIAISEIGHISERRTYLLISGQRGLPPFLVKSAGLDSGFMIAQYTAASIVSQNKQLCTPASVDSIVSSNGQEDHVSMGANAATKLYRIVQNTEKILAIELMNAAQALDFRDVSKTSPQLRTLHEAYRTLVPFLSTDRILHNDMQHSISFLNTYTLPA
ncbi:MAG: histidine ammonia-lyase [Chitinophagaceae bacterium]|nr:histidine ammonia-lyase [Chitinophagaceae bacterium]